MLQPFQDKIVVVTGGGSGIGAALAKAFDDAGATVAVVDLKGSDNVVQSLSNNYPHRAFTCDVTNQHQVQQTIAEIKQELGGRIDIYCSNAGIIVPPGNLHDDSVAKYSDDAWLKVMQVNVQSHVIAARELIPDWERGIGDACFVVTASAAGLLTMIGDASYGVSKAAAISFAEHVAIAHPTVQVHCLCPQAVDTPFTASLTSTSNSAMSDGILTADFVAKCTLDTIASNDNEFWILPHTRVREYSKRKALDHARWLKGMKSLRNKMMKANVKAKL